jgi:hypothetical protein
MASRFPRLPGDGDADGERGADGDALAPRSCAGALREQGMGDKFTFERYRAEPDDNLPVTWYEDHLPAGLDREAVVTQAGFDPKESLCIGHLHREWRANPNRVAHPVNALVVARPHRLTGEDYFVSREAGRG